MRHTSALKVMEWLLCAVVALSRLFERVSQPIVAVNVLRSRDWR